MNSTLFQAERKSYIAPSLFIVEVSTQSMIANSNEVRAQQPVNLFDEEDN